MLWNISLFSHDERTAIHKNPNTTAVRSCLLTFKYLVIAVSMVISQVILVLPQSYNINFIITSSHDKFYESEV